MDEGIRDWNFNEAFYQEIMNLWQQAHKYRQRAAEESSLESWWDAMRSIWAMMSYDIEFNRTNEEKDIKDYIEQIEKEFLYVNNLFLFPGQIRGKETECIKRLDIIEIKLNYLQGAFEYRQLKTKKLDPFKAIEEGAF